MFCTASRPITVTALASPLSNGSTPMNPVSGFIRAALSRCSPPPKPISNLMASTAIAKSRASLSGAGSPTSIRSFGRTVSIACRWPGRSAFPLRRPKNEPPRRCSLIPPSWRHSGQRAPDLLCQVGALPREAAVLLRRAAEVPVGGGAAVDRPVELQPPSDIRRRQAEELGQHLLELALVDVAGAGAVRVDE